ncbi:MAG: radical SAM protein, partial [Planctomycetaceae bacterium]|nr:radical SAM protein [Planctomycetaceae bacterium]
MNSQVHQNVSLPFHLMAKPIGPICNLDCHYCYYLKKEQLYPGRRQWQMSMECLASFIRQYIESQPPSTTEVTFAWQGGEPTLLGIPFFQSCLTLQQQYARPGTVIHNTIQTNGTLIDSDWCRLFREHKFLVGLSIDGPREMHDAFRVDRSGHPTHQNVLRALKLLQRWNVDFNALVTVHRANGNDGSRVYRYLCDTGVTFLQFIPIVEQEQNSSVHTTTNATVAAEKAPAVSTPQFGTPASFVTDRSVTPEQWG